MENSENKYSFDPTILKAPIERGPDFLTELFRLAMNEAMKLERENFLNAGAYERSKNRLDYANGFKPRTPDMRSGRVTFAIPQTRNGGFHPQALRKGLRSERALTIAMAEMYVQGVSTRKVKNVLEKMCGLEVSSTQVSDAAKTLDEEIGLFKERPLGCFPVLYVDAEYQRVRTNGSVVDTAVLQAVGIDAAGKREVIGMSVSTSEAEVHWRTFFTSLVNRGLHGVRLIVSDDHPGMKAARVGVFPAIPWQRCYFHLCQNAQSYARKLEERKEISRTMRDIFSRCGKDDALRALRGAVQYWNDTKKHSRFAEWLEDNAEESMTYFDFDEGWWRRIRTSNRIERLNKEIKKRTKVVGVFPNPESCERLIGSLLMEQHDEWMEGKAYLTGKEMEKSAFCA